MMTRRELLVSRLCGHDNPGNLIKGWGNQHGNPETQHPLLANINIQVAHH